MSQHIIYPKNNFRIAVEGQSHIVYNAVNGIRVAEFPMSSYYLKLSVESHTFIPTDHNNLDNAEVAVVAEVAKVAKVAYVAYVAYDANKFKNKSITHHKIIMCKIQNGGITISEATNWNQMYHQVQMYNSEDSQNNIVNKSAKECFKSVLRKAKQNGYSIRLTTKHKDGSGPINSFELN